MHAEWVEVLVWPRMIITILIGLLPAANKNVYIYILYGDIFILQGRNLMATLKSNT